jgi:hypothetical protein
MEEKMVKLQVQQFSQFSQLGQFSQLNRFDQLTKLTKLSKLTKPFLLLMFVAVSSHASCDLSATPANFAAQVTAAQAGQTICLATGNYGTWAGVNKAITIQNAAGATPVMGLNFNTGDAGFTLDGLSIPGGTILNGANHITIKNSAFTSNLVIDGVANASILLDNNTHININSCTSGCDPAALHLSYGSNTPSGVTVQNSLFQGGNADGIQAGTGLNILNNRFIDISEHGNDALHTDAIQLLTAKGAVLRGNYIYNCADGIVAYDGIDSVTIEDNVIDLVTGRYGIELYADSNSIIRHNTLKYATTCGNGTCGQIQLDHKTADPAGVGTIVENNVATLISLNNGSSAAVNRNNMLRSGASGTNFIGTPVYVGGANPTNNAGFALASNSPGKGAASDGLDVGIRVTATPGSACALPKYPTPACTGVPAGTALTTVNGDVTASTNGQVIDSKLITGSVFIAANNVVIKNSRIYGAILNSNGESYTVTDSEIGPLSGCNGNVAMGYENYTATRLHVHNFGDGPRVSGNNVTVQDSYINVCSNPGDHADGVQGYQGGTNVHLTHNTIDERNAVDVTAPVFFADNSQSAIVQNNLLAGGGYTLRLHDDFAPDHGPWQATGNRIVNAAWVYGPALTTNTDCNAATMTWSDNRLVTIDASYNVLTTGAQVNCDGSITGGGSPSACDLNQDSSTNVSDVQLCVNQAIGTTACASGDINKDSACNVVDVQRTVNAALGGQCVTQ